MCTASRCPTSWLCCGKVKHNAARHCLAHAIRLLQLSLKCIAPLTPACRQHDFWPVQAGEVTASTPWFETYKAEFVRTLLFNDHETFDHPLACGYLPTVVIDRHECH